MYTSYSDKPATFSTFTNSLHPYSLSQLEEENGGRDPMDIEEDRELFTTQPIHFSIKPAPSDPHYYPDFPEEFIYNECVPPSPILEAKVEPDN